MVRASYVHELRSAMTYPLAAALAEGSFTGIVAVKYFKASPVLLAVITAAPMFGNIMALLWAELARTRPKVRFVNWLQLGVVTSIAAVALTRPLPVGVGGWVFAGLIIVARVLASGILTVRSAIWRFNYPRQTRGQLVGRITMLATTVLTLTTFVGAWWLDRNPAAYAWLYPIAATLGILGIWQFSQIRVRGEGRMLRAERLTRDQLQWEARRQRQPYYTPRPETMAETGESNVLNYPVSDDANTDGEPRLSPADGARQRGPWRRFFSLFTGAFEVLRNDPEFRAYQRWQFINGAAFMAMTPPLVFMVSRRLTDEASEYLLATIVLQIVPMVTSIVFTQIWSPLFDRVHISSFRVWQGFVSVAAHALLFTGALLNSLWIVALAQFVVGVSNAAGSLAWNLGHNDFASPEKSGHYMAVHVMLTGLRGFVAPFLGVWLYVRLGLDYGIFAVTGCMCVAALLGFASMARRAPAKAPAARAKQVAEATGSR